MDDGGKQVPKEVFVLERKSWKPGDVVMRFGDWRKGEPCVMIDTRKWNGLGNPESVTVTVSASM